MSFDAQSFLSATSTAAMDTKVIPCPVGDFQGLIDKVVPRQWQSKDGTKSGVALDVFFSVEDENVKSYCGRDTITVKLGIMLDTTVSPSGALALDETKGKNIGLGRLREALNMNKPGQLFSFEMLPGQMCKVGVTHRIDGEDTYAEVKSVAKL